MQQRLALLDITIALSKYLKPIIVLIAVEPEKKGATACPFQAFLSITILIDILTITYGKLC